METIVLYGFERFGHSAISAPSGPRLGDLGDPWGTLWGPVWPPLGDYLVSFFAILNPSIIGEN